MNSICDFYIVTVWDQWTINDRLKVYNWLCENKKSIKRLVIIDTVETEKVIWTISH